MEGMIDVKTRREESWVSRGKERIETRKLGEESEV